MLGKVHLETRNPALVDMMEVMGITENRYSGVPTMRREMRAFGLPPPEFVNRNGEFRVILRNGLFSKIVPKLVNAGLLCLSRPEAPRSRLQRFTSAR